jgi:peptidoglycan/LPS O-acetylase OafA/YrhL
MDTLLQRARGRSRHRPRPAPRHAVTRHRAVRRRSLAAILLESPAGRSYGYIFLVWIAIAIGAAVAIAAGYVGFASLGWVWPPRLQAFGAGALLAMTAETMIPEAFHNSPRFSGLLAAFGFGVLLLVDATTR